MVVLLVVAARGLGYDFDDDGDDDVDDDTLGSVAAGLVGVAVYEREGNSGTLVDDFFVLAPTAVL